MKEHWKLVGPVMHNNVRCYKYTYYVWNWPSPIYRYLPMEALIWKGAY